ncbi:septum site-determining protein MinC [Selenomonas sp. KH1T6]|uniref:septum site-determining protein MinC n=1 Tax=Selenomonas sp. KH1T6 TaxID=3158784 RepID=UPI0008A7622F|nr:septum site-determining protein MinC [Selenomonas ruminantium]
MSEEMVKIKGGRSGLSLTFAPQVSFEDILQHLQEKLESGSGFFLRGTMVFLPRDVLTDGQREKLQKLFHEHGLICRLQPLEGENPLEQQSKAQPAPVPAESQPQAEAPQNPDTQEMLVVNKTLRGGQEIRTKSSVLVCGNVNPGAQIIAGGSIDVRGICRGMVHAGAYGDTSAIVVADHLMPTQIRIASFIARSPDHMDMTEKAERASIKDGQIVIEPIER